MIFEEPFRPECFNKQYNHLATNKFPKSKNSIDKIINSIKTNPLQGDRIPRCGQNIHIRKLRIGLKDYKISKRDGLRLIWLLIEKTKKVIMVAIYHKSESNNEQKTQAMIKENLRFIEIFLSE